MQNKVSNDYCWKFRVLNEKKAFLFSNDKEGKSLLVTIDDLNSFIKGHTYPAYIDIPKGILLAALAVTKIEQSKRPAFYPEEQLQAA